MISAHVLRATVAFIFLWHGVPKAIDWPLAAEKFAGWGLPGWLGPVTGIVEVIAVPLLFWPAASRPATLVLLAIILGALVIVQIPAGITAGFERDLMVAAGLLTLLRESPREDPKEI